MKQILVPKYFFNSGTTNQFSSDTTHANPVGFVSLDALNTFLSAAPTKDFAIMYRAGKTQAPNCIEVDYNSLEIVKSEPTKVYRIAYGIDVPAGEAGKTYTANIIKRNATKHERNVYRISVSLFSDCTAAELGNKLVSQFNKIKDSIHIDGLITSAYSSQNNRFEVVVNPVYANVSFTDALSGLTVYKNNANQESLTLDEKELYRRIHECIGNRGVQYTHEFGETIYPFQERLEEGVNYVVYTFRFAVGRKAAKTRDEVVYQLVHFIVNPALTALTTFIEGIKSDSN